MTPHERAKNFMEKVWHLRWPPYRENELAALIQEALDEQREKIAFYVDLCGSLQSSMRLNETLHHLATQIREKGDEKPQ